MFWSTLCILLFSFLQTAQSFQNRRQSTTWKSFFSHIPRGVRLFASERYSPLEINDFAKKWNVDTSSRTINKDVVSGKLLTGFTKELLFKPYPFTDLKLPYLKDSTKYFGGMLHDMFWHQDMDFVIMLLPINSDIVKSDVSVKFGSQSVTIVVKNEVILQFQCYDKITDGSAWHFEYDQNQQKYVFIELEKRLRYVNWKGLFGGIEEESVSETPEAKLKALEKLFAANQGLAKMSGENSRPATVEEMMFDSDLLSHVSDKVDTKPYAITDEEVEKDKLNLRMLRQLMHEKQKEEAIAAGKPPPVFDEDEDDEDGEEAEYQYLEDESDSEVTERTDEDLGDYDEEELNENSK